VTEEVYRIKPWDSVNTMDPLIAQGEEKKSENGIWKRKH